MPAGGEARAPDCARASAWLAAGLSLPGNADSTLTFDEVESSTFCYER
jgi:hypothetical protein